ncbi:MAG: YbhB/YbcL family Raf kinase inhibitor-like protein [Enterovibrio sp.]
MQKKLLASLIAVVGTVSLNLQAMTLTSPTFMEGKSLPKSHVFNSWGCTGQNLSPEIRWNDFPKETKSFAVTMYDPDAPTGSGWWHWVVVNIPATQMMLPRNAGAQDSKTMPRGAMQIRNDFGYAGFGGACPPPGAQPHRYQMTVYALNVPKLDLPANATPAHAGFLIGAHKIAEARITAASNVR